jgi:hypothetical protein
MYSIFELIDIAIDMLLGDGKGGWVDPEGKGGWDSATTDGKAGW